MSPLLRLFLDPRFHGDDENGVRGADKGFGPDRLVDGTNKTM